MLVWTDCLMLFVTIAVQLKTRGSFVTSLLAQSAARSAGIKSGAMAHAVFSNARAYCRIAKAAPDAIAAVDPPASARAT